jgi:carbonic anhydrase
VDSRVIPEVIFDQPIGALFVSRVPGNVASDSAKWMIDIATGEFNVPLIMVLGHTGCVAIKQVMEGKSGPGGLLRFKVQSAATKAGLKRPDDHYGETIRQNAIQTLEHLRDESFSFRDGLRAGNTSAVAAVYDMSTGRVELIGELTI